MICITRFWFRHILIPLDGSVLAECILKPCVSLRSPNRLLGNALAMKSDTQVQRDIIDELAWEPNIDAAAIGVMVVDDVVTLTGQMRSLAEKWAAEYVAKRVAGVLAVANDIVVHIPGESHRTDADIARMALHVLEWWLAPRSHVRWRWHSVHGPAHAFDMAARPML
jgi:BON domain